MTEYTRYTKLWQPLTQQVNSGHTSWHETFMDLSCKVFLTSPIDYLKKKEKSTHLPYIKFGAFFLK